MPSFRFAVVALCVAAGPLVAQLPPMERARPNDNRAKAGISSGDVLAVRIESRIAMWHPNGDDQPGAAIPVFAEIGRPAQIPGPLIRVAGGTQVIATVRNAIPNVMLTIHGLHTRPAIGALFNDSIQLAPGEVRTLRFRLDRPGTYYYWGTITGAALSDRWGDDAQLTGAIVVDEPGERVTQDRILVLGMWADSAASELRRHRRRELFTVNGRAWPHTDRLIHEQRDSIRWRVINATADAQTMHLHGHYFRVNRRGNGRADTLLATRPVVHTEQLAPGATIGISWLADRVGTWLFHATPPSHTVARGPMGVTEPDDRFTLAQANQRAAVAVTPLGGMMTAVEVRRQEDDTSTAPPLPEPARRLRMYLRPNIGSTPVRPYYSAAFDATSLEPAIPTGQTIGETVVLTRGEAVSVMVLNRLPEPTSLHWHGLETDNAYDGVPGVSGARPQVVAAIAPNDSFEVRLTPRRAGTFHYHAHTSEERQVRAGVVGAVLVVDAGRHDPARDLTLLVSSPSDSAAEARAVLVNGSLAPAPITLRRGTAARLRLINHTTGRPALRYELVRDSLVATWRPLAKDGMEWPAARRVIRPASEVLGIGETMDVEFFPTAPGDFVLEVRTPMGVVLGRVTLRVVG